ncbi:hypothetical protein [Limnospira platensis]|uniref:hypothetical protein n=1 Tax=Limnospira platensis TaxID=118562 RepID=UPI00049F330F|nr:hypothetical protein AP285_07430 [Arthrospira platensis YZ]KDR54229.1 hypothetical protein APPUASWS_029575 [Arthrospira platensis str. Paraca]MDF2210745.1 hypothetical protein [Arthrospira platensis NCB002]AMW29855.1 hypothetical protein AP285_19850 [Arthrospira platensis YZ]KDR58412.1 hypothetical protein APPUASWS_005175 [Arthrospira platensis str. Paraca]
MCSNIWVRDQIKAERLKVKTERKKEGSCDPLEYKARLRVTAVATPNLRNHNPRIDAGNGRRNRGTYL